MSRCQVMFIYFLRLEKFTSQQQHTWKNILSSNQITIRNQQKREKVLFCRSIECAREIMYLSPSPNIPPKKSIRITVQYIVELLLPPPASLQVVHLAEIKENLLDLRSVLVYINFMMSCCYFLRVVVLVPFRLSRLLSNRLLGLLRLFHVFQLLRFPANGHFWK